MKRNQRSRSRATAPRHSLDQYCGRCWDCYIFAAELVERLIPALQASRSVVLQIEDRAAWERSTRYVLEPVDIRVLNLLGEGLSSSEIAGRLHISLAWIKHKLSHLYQALDIPQSETRYPRILAAVYWHCELFQLGLRELGMLTN